MKKIKSIDLFAGCGGLMEGFEQTGLYETVAAVEWEQAPCNNLKYRLMDKWGYMDAERRVLRFDTREQTSFLKGGKTMQNMANQ